MPEYNIEKERFTRTDDEKKLRERFDDIRVNHTELLNLSPMAIDPRWTYQEIING